MQNVLQLCGSLPALGHKRTSRVKIRLCPRLSKSGETRARLNCPLCAKGDVVHRVHHKEEEERRLRATLAAIRPCGRPRVDDLPLRLENTERALWVRPMSGESPAAADNLAADQRKIRGDATERLLVRVERVVREYG